MSIKQRILVFQIIAAAALLAMAGVAYYGVRSANDYLARVQLSREQLDTATRLAIHANRFSEQIAELLLIGEPERPDFESAREQTSAAIADLRTITLKEQAFVDGSEKEEGERSELDRLSQMRALFREIDRAVERVLLLSQQGHQQDALALFRSEIENRLDAEFEKLIAAAVADERQEVASADARARLLSQRLLAGTLSILALLIATSLGAGFLFARSMEKPIRQLNDAAKAIERGDLDHRVDPTARDELGMLGRRFNAMADELQRQRQALVDARAHLERQVGERTGELERLNRQLTELDQQRLSFLADVSHELKTPLTALRGEAEVTLRGSSKPTTAYRAALANVVAKAVDMGRLIDDLLFLARTEMDEIRFDFRAVPMSKLLQESTRDVAVLARERRLELTLVNGAENSVVQADPRRLKQAFLIVLDNAIKYAGPKGPIDIELEDADGRVELRIRNSGPAIAPDEVPHVFDRFYRGSNAVSSAQGGSGLGLAIARWIIGKHGGSIDLSSASETGTEVRIRLPRMRRT